MLIFRVIKSDSGKGHQLWLIPGPANVLAGPPFINSSLGSCWERPKGEAFRWGGLRTWHMSSSLARNHTQVNPFGIPQTEFSDSGHCFQQKGRNSHSQTRFRASHIPFFRGRNSVFKVSRLESQEQNNDSESLYLGIIFKLYISIW